MAQHQMAVIQLTVPGYAPVTGLVVQDHPNTPDLEEVRREVSEMLDSVIEALYKAGKSPNGHV